jgi:hypothetical protein
MPASRGTDHVTPARLSEWEQRAFPALARLHRTALATPVDDDLPDAPWDHLDEARPALQQAAWADRVDNPPTVG